MGHYLFLLFYINFETLIVLDLTLFVLQLFKQLLAWMWFDQMSGTFSILLLTVGVFRSFSIIKCMQLRYSSLIVLALQDIPWLLDLNLNLLMTFLVISVI